MKKTLLLGTAALVLSASISVSAQNTPVSQMEKLDRGVVAVPAKGGKGYMVTWRLLGTDDANTTFTLLRNGSTAVKKGIADVTAVVDEYGVSASTYSVVTYYKGTPVDTSAAVKPWTNIYKSIQLDRPATGAAGASYYPNDCSAGDADGDGEYEIFVKWEPNNAKDNSQSGTTDIVYIDCYKLSGKKLWRINLGKNIRAGAHYTQFMVWDFDSDGSAELICKTGPGSIDGQGLYVTEAADDATIKNVDNTKDWRNGDGKVRGGQEYLTVFDGETGAAIHTIFYRPNRAAGYGGAPGWTFNWDDRSGRNDTEFGNRGERYLAAVAYLNGPDKNPSAVMCRGYYTWAHLWAVDFDGKKLKQRWYHYATSRTTYELTDSLGKKTKYTPSAPPTDNKNGSRTAYGNGNHNLTCGDVDGDGCDEIIWGGAGIDHDGKLMYATGNSHGDAMHLSDFDPTTPGMEVFTVHESGGGWDMHEAATGKIIHSHHPGSGDNGRGVAADIDPAHEGAEFWSASTRSPRNAITGETVISAAPSMNFRMYWDGDLQDELLDGNKLTKWNGSSFAGGLVNGSDFNKFASSSHCNSTKATPCLLADLFGDWREELVLWDGSNPSKINIFTTNEPTSFRLPTLMHDHTYRLAIAWQNVAYNQPPHLGYYLPNKFKIKLELMGKGQWKQTVNVNEPIDSIVIINQYSTTVPDVIKVITPDGTVYEKAKATSTSTYTAMGLKRTRSLTKKNLIITGAPREAGVYKLVVESGPSSIDNSIVQDTIVITSVDPTAIDATIATTEDAEMTVYNTNGVKLYSKNVRVNGNGSTSAELNGVVPGVYVVRFKTANREWSTKVTKE